MTGAFWGWEEGVDSLMSLWSILKTSINTHLIGLFNHIQAWGMAIFKRFVSYPSIAQNL
ncbi:hypothetical protein ACMYR3_16610 [Ampullimonas aquatilis]|uniref:hypothetical protein n=1 Tax=Ampullimonas aquatilis TaxID=1341549 RepID=UPI003C7347B0